MMNERIQELAIQSGFKKYKDDGLYSPYIEGEPLNDELQEFAELIVKECVEKITNYNLIPGHSAKWEDIYDIHARLLQDLGEELKEHFGVE
jgi:MoaA/NifB/PqqE/SkfB family radical SAM enzyme